ncbi:hypothetical protein [uncultured Selenomonas sp.]|nr:hypothetical protein [uncultured Selenomonas sp.]
MAKQKEDAFQSIESVALKRDALEDVFHLEQIAPLYPLSRATRASST